ncbi:hypothetical protein GGR57DRAFT_176942 [Xylariaceae sp. FL1272]|nr:hypothetical protein GGR57DRAFT_176942 [Xylariaceae sp. FL1272]
MLSFSLCLCSFSIINFTSLSLVLLDTLGSASIAISVRSEDVIQNPLVLADDSLSRKSLAFPCSTHQSFIMAMIASVLLRLPNVGQSSLRGL